MGRYELKIELLNGNGRKYMWKYAIKEKATNKHLQSGGVYYSEYSTYNSALERIKFEVTRMLGYDWKEMEVIA